MSNSRKNFAYKLGKIPRLERSNGLHFSSAVVFDFWNVKKQIRVDTRFSNKFATTVFWLYSNEGNSNSCNKNHVTCRFYKGSCLFTYFLYYLCCVVGCKNICMYVGIIIIFLYQEWKIFHEIVNSMFLNKRKLMPKELMK